uniref:Uncharacterized protein n=1 Tax=Enterobacter cloacae TaxID=550 RepID=A0A6C0NEL1_ENTCL|nr:Hypothetical protein [Enterobacter cloacae]
MNIDTQQIPHTRPVQTSPLFAQTYQVLLFVLMSLM